MRDPAIDEKEKLKVLKTRRDRLFDRFLKNPSDVRLAIEIKEIDDQVVASLARSAAKRRA